MSATDEKRSGGKQSKWGMLFALEMLFAAALISGCTSAGDGSATVSVGVSALTADDVSSLTVTVSGPGISVPIVTPLSLADGQWQGLISKIPSGTDRTFVAVAYAGTEQAYVGTATGVEIAPDVSAAVYIALQQSRPPTPFVNSAPVIDSLVASANVVRPGDRVFLRLAAHDPDPGDDLSYSWTATAGSFDSPLSSSPTWTAPTTAGTAKLTVLVSDSKAATQTLSFDVTVSSGQADGAATVKASLNTWPVVSSLTASPAQVDASQTTSLQLLASDPDGDTLTFAWTDGDCSGSFSDANAQDPTWTAPRALSSSSCTLSVMISDGRGGSNTASLTLAMGPAVQVNVAPIITNSFQSTDTASPGATVQFEVTAADPEGKALSFSWSAGTGTLAAATSTATTSEVAWTAPDAGCQHSITVDVSDNAGGVTSQTFAVSTCVAESCSDGLDNDGDGAVDCADRDCVADPACQIACGPDNCNGCCDASGQCQAGTDTNVCGAGGGTCGACDASQTCQSGVCTASTTCIDLAPANDGSSPARQALMIAEIVPGSWIELYNASTVPIALGTSAYQLGSQGSYIPVASLSAATLYPGDYISLPMPALGTGSGEVLLFLDSNFTSPYSIMDFVCWGATVPQSQKAQAEAGGKWFGACAGALAQGAIQRLPGTTGTNAGSYDTVSAPTPAGTSPCSP